MANGNTLSLETKFKNVDLQQQGWTFEKIANTLKVNLQTACSVYKAYLKDPAFSGLSRCGKVTTVGL